MRKRTVLVHPPVFGEAGDVVHVQLILLPVALPRLVIQLRFADHDSLQDCLVLLRHAQQFAHALLTIQTERRERQNICVISGIYDLFLIYNTGENDHSFMLKGFKFAYVTKLHFIKNTVT